MTPLSLILYIVFMGVTLPVYLVSFVVVPLMLLTKWKGYTTVFGNAKWGRGNAHPTNPTKSYCQELNWLVIRNPVNNLLTKYLAVGVPEGYRLKGDPNIGDKIKGGYYYATSTDAWEYYRVKPYNLLGRRCIRIRLGWKMVNSDSPAAWVLVINPFKKYLGV